MFDENTLCDYSPRATGAQALGERSQPLPSKAKGFMWNDLRSSTTDYKIGKEQVSWYKLGIRHAQLA